MRWFMLAALSFCAGAALTLLPLAAAAAILLSCLLLSAVSFLLPRLRRRIQRFLPRLGIALLLCIVGLAYGTVYRSLTLTPARALMGTSGEYCCEAAGYPVEAANGFRLEVRLPDCRGLRVTTFLRTDTAASLQPGDRFTAELTLTDSASGGSLYSYADGVYLSAFSDELITLTPCSRPPLRYLPCRIAHALEESLSRAFPEDVLGWAVALTTGNRSLLPRTDKLQLQRAGIYHALALSGMHMSVLVGCLLLVRRRRRLRALLGIPLCIAFAVITGLSPSIVRAAVVQCLLLLSAALYREDDAPTSLSAAALLLVLQNPWSLASWGMQLSFASVIGLLLFGRRLYRLLCSLRPDRFPTFLWRIPAAAFSAALAAMSLTVPLMAVDFGFISLIAPIANLLCGGVVTVCFTLCLIIALLGLLFTGPAAVLAWITAWGFRYVKLCAGLLSRIPLAAVYTSGYYFLFWLILFYALLALLLLSPGIRRTLPICCIISTFFLCLLLTLLEGLIPSFSALNVGQGQCLLFRLQGHTVMVDCGSARTDAGAAAADCLAACAEPDLDLLVLTHYDSDHISGAAELLSLTRVRGLVLPDTDSPEREALEAAAFAAGVPVYPISQDTSIWMGDISLRIFAPLSGSGSNDSGLSVLGEIPGMQVLITGDMDRDTELALLETHSLPDLDILVAGHHGAATSTGTALLRVTAPEKCVISVGRNSYGHPAEETLQRITDAGAAIYRTDSTGLSGRLVFYPTG